MPKNELENYDLQEMANMDPIELKRYVQKLYHDNRKPTIFGYARVSTHGQAVHGNSLSEQHEQLEQAGCEIIVEEQYTGKTMKRPKFDELMKTIRAGDTLTVTKLDRFARTAADGSTLIQQLLEKGVKVHVLNMGLIDNSPIGKVIVNVLLAFAQFERDMIVERTQAGKAIARTHDGFREGRPPIPEARKAAAVRMVLDQKMTYNEAAEAVGISKSTLTRAVRAEKARRMDSRPKS